jgi:Na+/H+-dicarboxylate symporter
MYRINKTELVMKAFFFFTCVAIVIGCGVVYAMTPSQASKQRTQAIKECVKKNQASYETAGAFLGYNKNVSRTANEYSCTHSK